METRDKVSLRPVFKCRTAPTAQFSDSELFAICQES